MNTGESFLWSIILTAVLIAVVGTIVVPFARWLDSPKSNKARKLICSLIGHSTFSIDPDRTDRTGGNWLCQRCDVPMRYDCDKDRFYVK